MNELKRSERSLLSEARAYRNDDSLSYEQKVAFAAKLTAELAAVRAEMARLSR